MLSSQEILRIHADLNNAFVATEVLDLSQWATAQGEWIIRLSLAGHRFIRLAHNSIPPDLPAVTMRDVDGKYFTAYVGPANLSFADEIDLWSGQSLPAP